MMNRTRVSGGAGADVRAFLWGAAHALDLGGVLLAEQDWGGMEADAEALSDDWRMALDEARQELHVSEEGEGE
jgi:hypothetical protein